MDDLDSTTGTILLLASAASAFVKPIVDAFKMARPSCNSWEPILLAFILGPVILFLLQLATNQPLTSQSIAISILGGLMAGLGAVGTTQLHTKAREREDDLINEQGLVQEERFPAIEVKEGGAR